MALFIRIINILFIQSKIKFYLMLTLLLFASAIESIGISLIIPIVEIINSSTNTVEIFNYVFEKKNLLFYIFTFFILKYFFLLAVYFLQSKYVYSIQAFFSNVLFQKYLNLSLIKHKQTNTNVVSRNIYNEVNEFAQISNILISTINEIVIIIGIFIIFLLFLPLEVILSSLLIFVISFIFIKILSKKIKLIGFKRQEFDGKRLITINEAFKGIKEIISFGLKNLFIKKYSKDNYNSAKESSKMLILKHVPRITIEFIIIIIFLYFLVINLNNEMLENEKFFSIFALLGVSMLRMLPSINKIIIGSNQINYGKAIVDVVEDGLKINKNEKNSELKNFTEEFKNISFKNVSFSYQEKNIIEDLNLEINKGEKIGIIGKSGSGKTTIIDLLMGLLKPETGGVFINKYEIKKLNLIESNIFSYIPQKSFILDDNIINNITFGDEKDIIDMKHLKFIMQNTCLEEFLNDEEIYLNKLGDSGDKLSGGQIQRITIARALFKKSQILIMDESTSSLDKITQQTILNNIKQNFSDLTLIIVSHDKDVFSICDKIYKLENGKVNLL